jgi:hypothetical protein
MAAKKSKGSKAKKTGRTSTNPNTRARAIGKIDYEPVPEPATLHEALQAINMWGFYFSKWGYRIDAEFHKIEKLIGATTGTTAEHLDPPPEPFK